MLAGANNVSQSQRSLVRADSVINTTILGARFCQDFVFKAASEEFAKLTYARIELNLWYSQLSLSQHPSTAPQLHLNCDKSYVSLSTTVLIHS